MNDKEIKLFYEMCSLYEQVGELTIDEDSTLQVIIKLGDNFQFDSIEILYNEDMKFKTGKDLFKYYFDLSFFKLNQLANEFGYEKVKDINEKLKNK